MKKNIENIARRSDYSEKMIERHLVETVERMGGRCLKYSNSSQTGYPDRLVLLPHGRCLWFELKSRGRKPTRLQEIRHAELRELGFQVVVADTREAVDEMMGRIGHEI